MGGDVQFSKNRLSIPLFDSPENIKDLPTQYREFRRVFLEKLDKACPDNKLPVGTVVKVKSTVDSQDAEGKIIKTPIKRLKVIYTFAFDDVDYEDNTKQKVPQEPLTTLMTEKDVQQALDAGHLAQYANHPAVVKFLKDHDEGLIRRPAESDLDYLLRAGPLALKFIGNGSEEGRVNYRKYDLPKEAKDLRFLDSSELSCSGASQALTTLFGVNGIKSISFTGQVYMLGLHARLFAYLRSIGWVGLRLNCRRRERFGRCAFIYEARGDYEFYSRKTTRQLFRSLLRAPRV